MAEFINARGARRSANPTYNRWIAPQSSAESSASALSALMRQPQQAQQAAPQMQRMNETPQQGQLGGIDPAAMQAMIREQVRAQQEREAVSQLALDERNTQSADGAVNETSTQAGMGPPSAGTMRALRMALGLGLSGMGLGPMAAMLGGAINNPDSATAPTTALGMSAIRRAVPQLGMVDTLAQMFGVDPITRQVDQAVQAAIRPAATTPASPEAIQAQIALQSGQSSTYGGDRGPGGSSGPTDGMDGNYVSGSAYGPGGFPGDDSDGDFGGSLEGSNFGGSGSSGGNSGRGGIRGGGSFGEGQY